METKKKAWIGALRLRTLPLAAGGIILGSFLPPVFPDQHSWLLFILALLTAFGLQIISNLANDYGDFVKGTDNDNRVGPQRALQSGLISQSEMKKALIGAVVITFLLGNLLLILAFDTSEYLKALGMLALGVFGIWAAIRYTVGEKPYGYAGWGDVFVVLFFGLVSVWGVSFLHVKSLQMMIILPALSYGFLSAGVLNINNMRDIENDRASNKRTLVVKLGPQGARLYHFLLMLAAFLCQLFFILDHHRSNGTTLLVLLALPISFLPIIINTIKVLKHKGHPSEYNPFLKGLSIGSLLQVILYVVLLYLIK